MIKQSHIDSFTRSAREIVKKTTGTMVVYAIYADSCYALDTEEYNVIDFMRTEREAKENCKAINSGEFSENGFKSECYYKARVIDAETGERITRKNIKNYLKPQYKNEHI